MKSIAKKTATALAPTTFAQWLQLAEYMAKSSLVPKDFREKPGDCLVAMQMGASVGLNPFQAIQSIAVINGRPCMWGDAVLGIVWASGLCEDIEETDDGTTATCTAKRKGKPTPTVRSFSKQSAINAKVYQQDKQGNGSWVSLSERAIWKSYPERMRQMRARSWCLRDLFPDVLKGLAVREEVEDYGDPEPVEPKLVGGQTLEERMAGMMPRERVPVVVVDREDKGVGETGLQSPAGAVTIYDTTPPKEKVVAPGASEPDAGNREPNPVLTATVSPAEETQPVVETQEAPREQVQAPPAEAQETRRAADPESAQPDLPAGQTEKPNKLRFTVGQQKFETNGITRVQLMELFKICPRVGKKCGPDKPAAVLLKEFGLQHRVDLTEEQAEKYQIRMREMLEGA